MRLEVDVGFAVGRQTVGLTLASDADVVAIVGPSGAGKSTLLRVIAGVERRATGTVTFGGARWQGPGTFVAPHARNVGWVPQDPTLFPHRSVRDNLGWAGPPEEAPEWLEIGHLLPRMPRNLSGGERQRVAMGRAWASRPRLLLLDEPFSALDRPLRARLAPELARRASEAGVPIVISSHDDGDLRLLGAEVWRLDGAGLSPPGRFS